MRYPVRLQPDDGTILVTCPDLPEVTTFGEDEDDALLRAVEAIESAIQGRISDREDVPLPSTKGEHFVALPAQAVMKLLLYRAMRERNVRKAELAKRLGWHGPQVDRLLDLRHASRLDQIEAAFRTLGKEIDVGVRDAA
jgi:antitoxin HicB